MTDKPETDYICVGTGLIQGGKVGHLWLTMEAFAANPEASLDQLRTQASAFQIKGIIGGIYRGSFRLGDEGQLASMSTRPSFQRQDDSRDWGPAQLMAESLETERRAEALEKRVKKDSKAMAEVRELARILKAVPFRQRYRALQVLTGIIDEEARKA